ncbi:MAG TPA: UdgX family uracil-DNA binding protein [Polyangia bacterium]|jgi:DNA polymerase|nr:UdgX family uracil-DNA binding protein [Polyangia bacterium]
MAMRDSERRRRVAWESAAQACRQCQRCPLYRKATQSVWGEGPLPATVMLVGEQPGDKEDRQGHPFVGPAGALLQKILAELDLVTRVYITNAVKHFSFVERGKVRLHKKPERSEVVACRPWLLQEVELVRPQVVVALGATAAFSLFGAAVTVMRDRGRPLALPATGLGKFAAAGLVTFHPSAILRAPTPERRRELRQMVHADLQTVARLVDERLETTAPAAP